MLAPRKRYYYFIENTYFSQYNNFCKSIPGLAFPISVISVGLFDECITSIPSGKYYCMVTVIEFQSRTSSLRILTRIANIYIYSLLEMQQYDDDVGTHIEKSLQIDFKILTFWDVAFIIMFIWLMHIINIFFLYNKKTINYCICILYLNNRKE